MSITRILSRQAFEPEIIEDMSAAYGAVCQALRLNAGDDPATRMVAEKFIELAQRGIRDVTSLQTLTLKQFGAGGE
ncbi:MAG TPA: hypothetical protein VH206_17600 [Xanthobacteraceae bacterium]|jgi:hypothetical protein|nr:hypothetical protein [Xanthobacteraceae bacterium]